MPNFKERFFEIVEFNSLVSLGFFFHSKNHLSKAADEFSPLTTEPFWLMRGVMVEVDIFNLNFTSNMCYLYINTLMNNLSLWLQYSTIYSGLKTEIF